MAGKVERLKVIHNVKAAPGHFRLGLSWRTPEIEPGQFVMLKAGDAPDGCDPLLRRPFGIHKVLGRKRAGALKGSAIEILYRVVGRGTRMLSGLAPGDTVDLMGPLGRGFMPHAGLKRPVMVAGGMGIAPLYPLAERLKGGLLLYGARGRNEAALAKDFLTTGCELRIATEDGSAGVRGLATDLLDGALTPDDVVYACGPAGMLKRVAGIAAREGARCYVSLERAMACGIGVCLGCAVAKSAYPRDEERAYGMVCTDGPVFDARDVDWASF
jgi:dihydroorotate dehydrogenase electron transfer subunit